MSILLGAVTWFILAVLFTNSENGGSINKAILSFYGPAYRAGTYVGSFFFPHHAIRGTTGWYVVPLFGIFGEFVLLVIVWYFCLRIKRAFDLDNSGDKLH